jgi:predicted phosphodiesterase
MGLRVFFLGDTQATLLVERLAGRENNAAARARLFELLETEKPDAAVLLGDMVARPSETHWGAIDGFLRSWGTHGTQLALAVGNHDVMFEGHKGYRQMRARGLLPQTTSWSQLDVGCMRVLALDSNRGKVGSSGWAAQIAWFDQALAEAEREHTVKLVVVASHHPPYTNGALVRPHAATLAPHLASFAKSSKAQMWISGHCHAYERFHVSGKTHVVAGNAGGPRMGLLTGALARHSDLARAPNPVPFGWLTGDLSDNALACSASGFLDTAAPLDSFDRFELRF